MALSTAIGFTGFEAARFSSQDGRAIGKLTDMNHLYSFHDTEPSDYDKKIITLYTQTAMYNNDFLNMINNSTPYYPDSDYWKWDIGVPYSFPALIEIPNSTAIQANPGIDGHIFEIVLSRKEFFVHDVITADRRFGQNFYIVEDPLPYNMGWKYRCTLLSQSPQTDYVSAIWLTVGLEFMKVDNLIGEFDQELSGLPSLGQKITLYESLAAGFGHKHTITSWADAKTMKDSQGRPLDIMVYKKFRRNELSQKETLDIRWEPFVETQMRREQMETKVRRMIWGKPGTARTGGEATEIKKAVEGLYWKMRNNGNLVQYNRGDFSINIMRNVFGDLFYRRVDMSQRHVKVYTNEQGFSVFNQAAKKDALNAGIVFTTENDKFISGSGQHLTMSFAFDSVVTQETGKIELIHLKELDEPQTNSEFGQNKKSPPVFLVFDISPDGDGTPKNNVREVRMKGQPSMTWGYVDGRRHHLGFAASQGMQSANMFPGYTMWMEDRADIFVEDLSRMVIIEEIPQY